MKSKTLEMERTSIWDKDILKAAVSGILSFLFGGTSLFGAVSPFGIAAVTGFPLKYTFTAVIGSIIGSLFFKGTNGGIYYSISILIAFTIRILLTKLFHRRIKAGFLSLLAFAVMAFCATFYGLLKNIGTMDFTLLCIEAALGGCFTYFFAISGKVILYKKTPAILNYPQTASLLILFIALICSLTGLKIFNVNIGVIAGVLSIYIAMSKRGIVGASVSAISVSIALNLYSTEMLSFSGMLIIAGFIAGAFSPLKKIGQLISFVFVSTFFLFLTGAPIMLTYRLVDIFLATAIYVLIPERWIDQINSKNDIANPKETLSPQMNISTKLAFASDTIRDLQDELLKVSKKFHDIDCNNIDTIYDATANIVCRGCTKMLVCWDSDCNDTINAFNPISDTLRLNGEITPNTLPAYFKERCCKTDKLCAAINEYYRGFISKQNAKRQVSDARRIVFEQFHSIADMLIEVSKELSDITSYDNEMTKEVSSAFKKLEKNPEQIICPIDRFGRNRIEIYTDNTIKTSPKILCETLSEAAGREFDLPSISRVQGKTRISLFEKACYSVDFSAQQSCCGDNSVCGDSYEYFSDAQGYIYILLSDGMGIGKRAAIDSVMTCSILIKLLKAGFGLPSAIKLLNSSLVVKSTDESLSTIDLMKVDLYSGKAELYKAGAATTFLYSKGEIKRFSSNSPPVGILEDVGYDKQNCQLSEEDIIVMVSDGAVGSGEGWIGDEIRKSSHLSSKEIAVKLCYEAKRKAESSHQDDITIITAKLKKGV